MVIGETDIAISFLSGIVPNQEPTNWPMPDILREIECLNWAHQPATIRVATMSQSHFLKSR